MPSLCLALCYEHPRRESGKAWTDCASVSSCCHGRQLIDGANCLCLLGSGRTDCCRSHQRSRHPFLNLESSGAELSCYRHFSLPMFGVSRMCLLLNSSFRALCESLCPCRCLADCLSWSCQIDCSICFQDPRKIAPLFALHA